MIRYVVGENKKLFEAMVDKAVEHYHSALETPSDDVMAISEGVGEVIAYILEVLITGSVPDPEFDDTIGELRVLWEADENLKELLETEGLQTMEFRSGGYYIALIQTGDRHGSQQRQFEESIKLRNLESSTIH